MSEQAGVAGAGGEAGAEALPEAVEAGAQIVDEFGWQPPAGRAVEVIRMSVGALYGSG